MRKNIAIVGITGSLVLALSGPASAVNPLTSWQGDDYSQDLNSITQVKACDGEVDGHGVHSDYYRTGSPTQYQVHNDGGSGTCATSGTGNKLYSHRIVEEISFAEDPKGPWVYPT